MRRTVWPPLALAVSLTLVPVASIAGCSAIVDPDTSRLQPGTDGGVVGTDSGAPVPCSTPGAVESVACGMCGTTQRTCGASGSWEYGACAGEGECAAGTVGEIACGRCGTQPARCTASCTWETTGSCGDEGECAPGARTRTSTGCAAGQTREVLCSDACEYEPASACVDDSCPTSGAIEQVRCGNCGRQQRFCSGAHVWEYGPCGDEGPCTPGTTSTSACGMCGEQTARCDESCQLVPFGACEDEGTCVPGAIRRTSMGCPAGQTRTVQCDDACTESIVVSPCTAARSVDVTFLLDVTGSNNGSVSTDLPTIQSRCIAPLLALGDVMVGVSYTGEFPVMPYGQAGDRPFEGGIEPTSSATSITTEIAGRPLFAGSDAQDATIEALSMLAGGPVAMSSVPLSCSAGRAAGGCWRAGAQRVIVVHTDSPIHNGPIAGSTMLLAPYSGITPAPATWPEARTRLAGTLLVWLDSDSADPAPSQFDQMLTDLGQPRTDHHDAPTSASVGTACDAIVARVRALL